MGDSARDRRRGSDHRSGDHYPTCPRCGDLCGVHARICANCGVRLTLDLDAPIDVGSAPVTIPTLKRQTEREAMIPTSENEE